MSTPARRRVRVLVLLVLAPLLLALLGPPPAPAAPSPAAAVVPVPAGGLETDTQTRPVAPGLDLTSFDRYVRGGSGEVGGGWLRADALAADLSGGLSVDYLNSGAVADTSPLREQAEAAGAVAAVNGDYFDINNSGAAEGIGIQDGELVQSPIAGHHQAVSITAEGVGEVVEAYFEGSATLASRTEDSAATPASRTEDSAATGPAGAPIDLTQFNNRVQPDGVGVFTSLWGTYPRTRAVAGASEVTELVLADGEVAEIDDQAGSGPIPAGATVLLGREAGAEALAGLTVGDPVEVTYQPRLTGDGEPVAAVGGRHVLVHDGEPQPVPGTPAPEPRTGIGFSADGQTMYLITVDGRQVDSRGATLPEMGELLAELGAHHALELDGGGSSTLVARKPGEDAVQVENSPSDGSERPVPNGLAIYAPAGSGELTGFWVEPAADPATAPGLGPVPGGHPDRIFPGLTRPLRAAGHDETYGPADGEPQWRVEPSARGVVDADGFHAKEPGTATVTAFEGAAGGSVELTVLGPLDRIAATDRQVGLSGADDDAQFGVVGADAAGRTAPIGPADVSLTYDPELLEVTGDESGWFTVQAIAGSGSDVITATVAGEQTSIPVTVGLTEQVVADFTDADQWWYDSVPVDVDGFVEPADGRDGPGVRLSADFSQHTVTRAAYANPPALIDVPGQPQAFTMGIHGAGNGEWASLHLVDANGSDVVLRGPNVTWTGWREVRFEVPDGVAYPVQVRRFYAPEINADAAYQSELVIDEIVALTPPEVDAPPEPVVADPVIGTGADVAGADWRFAVMADAQFTSDDPESEIVAQTRRTLREIKAADPEFLVINGDFVDRALPDDFALAKRILDEELAGELPYYYVPGNHEIMGAPIDDFEAVFGDTYRVFDHKGTRFVTLNTATGLLRSEFEQLRILRQALDEAADDPSIGSVAVLQHHPPRDIQPTAPGQLSDRKEAALLERWLAEFQRATGKGALFVGAHTGYFHASRVDGVPYLSIGNSGKDPATPPDAGGFTGWALMGVDPVSAEDAAEARRDLLREAPEWAFAQVRPHVDKLSLAVAQSAPVGEPLPVAATVEQNGAEVPAAWPASVDWSASAGVHVGSEAGVKPRHLAWFDPVTGTFTALRPAGTVALSATVNEETVHTRIRLAPRP